MPSSVTTTTTVWTESSIRSSLVHPPAGVPPTSPIAWMSSTRMSRRPPDRRMCGPSRPPRPSWLSGNVPDVHCANVTSRARSRFAHLERARTAIARSRSRNRHDVLRYAFRGQAEGRRGARGLDPVGRFRHDRGPPGALAQAAGRPGRVPAMPSRRSRPTRPTRSSKRLVPVCWGVTASRSGRRSRRRPAGHDPRCRRVGGRPRPLPAAAAVRDAPATCATDAGRPARRIAVGARAATSPPIAA